jgi:hypothetical protein
VGMFAWTDIKTVDAIIKAAQSGIKVTLYIDGHQNENDAAIKKLKDAKNINVIIAQSKQWLHLKVLVQKYFHIPCSMNLNSNENLEHYILWL